MMKKEKQRRCFGFTAWMWVQFCKCATLKKIPKKIIIIIIIIIIKV